MIRYFCDACKKEIKEIDGTPIRGATIRLNSNDFFQPSFKCEVCEDCYDKILRKINEVFLDEENKNENNNKD